MDTGMSHHKKIGVGECVTWSHLSVGQFATMKASLRELCLAYNYLLAGCKACSVSSMKWQLSALCRHTIKDPAWKVCLGRTQQYPSSRVQQTWSGLCERCLWRLRTQDCAWNRAQHSKVWRSHEWKAEAGSLDVGGIVEQKSERSAR